jgi:hypothetical protein
MKVVPIRMVRSRWVTLGLIATVALFIIALGAPLAGQSGPVAYGKHPIAASGAHPAVRPAAGIGATILITNLYVGTVTPPVWVNYTIVPYGVPLKPGNISTTLAITAGTPSTLISNRAYPVVSGQSTYHLLLDYFAIGGFVTLPQINYTFQVKATVSDPNFASVHNKSNVLTISTLVVVNPDAVFSNTIPVYTTYPIQVNWSVSLDAANSGITASAANETVGLSFAYSKGTCAVYSATRGCRLYNPAVVGNVTETFAASGQYGATIDAAFGARIGYDGGQLPTGTYLITPYVKVWNSANPAQPDRTVQSQRQVLFTLNSPTAQIVTPLNTTGSLFVGSPVTISVGYTGDYITGATVNVLDSAKNVVYTQGVFQPGNGAHSVSVTWVPGAQGTYSLTLTLNAPYVADTTITDAGVVVLAAPASISYVNSTGILGSLAPGVAAAILLVVGLVVGMIVALALGRMMWGSGRPATAQPWKATPAAGANECSVCHQTFATPEELKDHSKQAHGMG